MGYEDSIAISVKEMTQIIEALQEAKLQIEYLHEKFQPTGSGNNVLDKIEVVLKRRENF